MNPRKCCLCEAAEPDFLIVTQPAKYIRRADMVPGRDPTNGAEWCDICKACLYDVGVALNEAAEGAARARRAALRSTHTPES